MNPTTLKGLAKLAYDTSKSMMEDKAHEELVPIFIILQADGELQIMGTPFYGDESKQAIADMLREKFRAEYVKAYIHVSEAWMLSASPSEGMPTVRPSESERRQEALIIAGQDRDGNFIHQIAHINRDQDNKRTLAPVDKEFSKAERISGRFATLLD